VRQLLADATAKPVLVTEAEEPVLLGAAMLGAVAGGLCEDVRSAMARMSRIGKVHAPANSETASDTADEIAALHDARYDAFRQLQSAARAIRQHGPVAPGVKVTG
jgi:D-ribulokinase